MDKVLYKAYWVNTNLDAEYWSEQVIEIKFKEYPVIKQTDKTYTVRIGTYHNGKYGDKSKTVVLKDQSGKRFAYETKERALEAFIIKRKSYGRRLKNLTIANNNVIEIATNLRLS